MHPEIPLVEELTPPPDPWDAARRLAHRRFFLFLDSAGGPASLCRYSYLAAEPFRVLRFPEVDTADAAVHPFDRLDELVGRYSMEPVAGLPPFQGGAAGLFSYSLGGYQERLPRPRCDEFHFPDLLVGFYDWVLAFDHAAGRAWLISTGWPRTNPEERARHAAARLREVRGWLTGPAPTVTLPGHRPIEPRFRFPVEGRPNLASSFDRAGYLAAVRRAVAYVHAGDCFQVNLAQRLLTPATLPPLELYGRLRERNPAPFAGYFDAGEFIVASASPERFLKVDDGNVQTCPIKGTRPRGAAPADDAARAAELLASPKDRAENVMIVDLLRNDLGRVCRYGSVRVADLCRLETYPTVHHLVSEVHGVLREGAGRGDLLRAAFPGGSVTGAPKVRAMEIIAELEPVARGPYCGSLAYLGFNGSMDANILIRTFALAGGWAQFPVGGGIVADSSPEREYEETWHKAEGLLRALRSD